MRRLLSPIGDLDTRASMTIQTATSTIMSWVLPRVAIAATTPTTRGDDGSGHAMARVRLLGGVALAANAGAWRCGDGGSRERSQCTVRMASAVALALAWLCALSCRAPPPNTKMLMFFESCFEKTTSLHSTVAVLLEARELYFSITWEG